MFVFRNVIKGGFFFRGASPPFVVCCRGLLCIKIHPSKASTLLIGILWVLYKGRRKIIGGIIPQTMTNVKLNTTNVIFVRQKYVDDYFVIFIMRIG
jgi:hypothetical protein